MNRRTTGTLACLGLVMALSACSSQGADVPSGELSGPADPGVDTSAEGVVEVLDVLAPALTVGDGPGACSLMAADAQRRFEELTGTPTCIDAVAVTRTTLTSQQTGLLAGDGSWSVTVDGEAATVAGERADVLASVVAKASGPLRLVRLEGRWALR